MPSIKDKKDYKLSFAGARRDHRLQSAGWAHSALLHRLPCGRARMCVEHAEVTDEKINQASHMLTGVLSERAGANAPDIPPDRSLRCVYTGHSDLLDPDASFKRWDMYVAR